MTVESIAPVALLNGKSMTAAFFGRQSDSQGTRIKSGFRLAGQVAWELGITTTTAVQLSTAAVLPNTPTYANGALGVGATLTAGANSTLTVDGVLATIGQRVLVKD